MDGVALSISKARLLGYVRSLRIEYIRHLLMDFRRLPRHHGGYLPSIHNAHSLTLSHVRAEKIPQDQFFTCFSALRETITHLSLEIFVMSFSAFVALVDHFPNIRSLQLSLVVPERDEGPVPSLSRPLRGKLRVRAVQAYISEFFGRFTELDLEYEELVIESSSFFVHPVFLKSALLISTSTVKFLRIISEVRRE